MLLPSFYKTGVTPERPVLRSSVMIPQAMTPEPPAAPRFDAEQDAWVISRYSDVAAALREPRLWPVAGKYQDRDEAGKLHVRPAMLDALGPERTAEWQAGAEHMAAEILGAWPAERPMEVLGDFARPWCLSVAMMVTEAPESQRARLAGLGESVFAATGAPDTSPLRAPAAEATGELDRFFEKGPIPMGEPSFIALSQTTARLLTNSWLALFLHPAEYARLRRCPELMASAVDEFLRYAGIVRRVFRRATAPLQLGGVSIAEGQRVALMLASANRDAAVFADPDRFDVGRCSAGQLALGAGRNSCVGAAVIRMALSAATRVFVQTFESVKVIEAGEWKVGSGFCFPAAIRIVISGKALSRRLLT